MKILLTLLRDDKPWGVAEEITNLEQLFKLFEPYFDIRFVEHIGIVTGKWYHTIYEQTQFSKNTDFGWCGCCGKPFDSPRDVRPSRPRNDNYPNPLLDLAADGGRSEFQRVQGQDSPEIPQGEQDSEPATSEDESAGRDNEAPS